MVDVGRKPPLQRIATAEGFLVAAKATIDRIMSTPPRKARSAGGRGSGGAGGAGAGLPKGAGLFLLRCPRIAIVTRSVGEGLYQSGSATHQCSVTV